MGSIRLAGVALACVLAAPTRGEADDVKRHVLVADRDDDDVDGSPDGDQARLPLAAQADLVPVPPTFTNEEVTFAGDGAARVIAGGGAPLAPKQRVPAGALLQGVRPGEIRVSARGKVIAVLDVIGIDFVDGEGTAVTSHASLARTPPARLEESVKDPDALRARVTLPAGASDPSALFAESVSALGVSLDALQEPLTAASCAPELRGVHCFVTAPNRLVVDAVDRSHPLVIDRSLRGEVGGALVMHLGADKSQRVRQAIRVQGPRTTSAGPIGRLRVAMRPFVLRMTPGGSPAIGGNDAGAIAVVRAELSVASATWGQCGITFGDVQALDVRIVDPPPPHLLAIGDDAGLPSAGGELRFRADDKNITVAVPPGSSVDRAATLVSIALSKAGFVPQVSTNPRIAPGASGAVDVSVRRANGSLASLVPGAPLSTDPVLSVRVGSVDLSDGLLHFGDIDSNAGTLEERTLVKALDDQNPLTVEVVIIPFFSGSGRIGESFIGTDSPSMRNVILMDRAGVRARKSSLTLAHELGHVLLNAPDHPDDYGVDTPTLLMDSDASDASAFGPRRLTESECARALRESGPSARVPLLQRWPLAPLAKHAWPR